LVSLNLGYLNVAHGAANPGIQGSCVLSPPYPLKEQKSAEAIENKGLVFEFVQKSESDDAGFSSRATKEQILRCAQDDLPLRDRITRMAKLIPTLTTIRITSAALASSEFMAAEVPSKTSPQRLKPHSEESSLRHG
jgi:hypothetical protein